MCNTYSCPEIYYLNVYDITSLVRHKKLLGFTLPVIQKKYAIDFSHVFQPDEGRVKSLFPFGKFVRLGDQQECLLRLDIFPGRWLFKIKCSSRYWRLFYRHGCWLTMWSFQDASSFPSSLSVAAAAVVAVTVKSILIISTALHGNKVFQQSYVGSVLFFTLIELLIEERHPLILLHVCSLQKWWSGREDKIECENHKWITRYTHDDMIRYTFVIILCGRRI